MEHVLLLDMAIHTFDQARLITGADPVSVYRQEWNPAGSCDDHDASLSAFFEMSDGLVFTYQSWCAEDSTLKLGMRLAHRWNQGKCSGTAVRVSAHRRLEKAVDFHAEMRDLAVPELSARDRVGGHAGLIDEFVHCVRRGRTPETVCTDNVRVWPWSLLQSKAQRKAVRSPSNTDALRRRLDSLYRRSLRPALSNGYALPQILP